MFRKEPSLGAEVVSFTLKRELFVWDTHARILTQVWVLGGARAGWCAGRVVRELGGTRAGRYAGRVVRGLGSARAGWYTHGSGVARAG